MGSSPGILTAELEDGEGLGYSVLPGGSAGSGFAGYLATKMAAAIVSLAVTLVIAFVLFSVMPANPIRTITQGHPETRPATGACSAGSSAWASRYG